MLSHVLDREGIYFGKILVCPLVLKYEVYVTHKAGAVFVFFSKSDKKLDRKKMFCERMTCFNTSLILAAFTLVILAYY